MDNAAIVDQIARSLSFEIVAVPQNVTQVDSTSKSIPLNVKIRVRKKHGAELRHGVLSMHIVDTISDNPKNVLPERVRLVSSDQTIMNFNILMEAEFDKTQQTQNLNIISPGLEVNDNNYEILIMSNNASELLTAPVLSKKNKDIFGRCKPGGCLDPPFGEDKYLYQPTQKSLPLPVKDDTAKLRSSSIFKNNIFKRKKKSLQCDDELSKHETNNKDEVDFTTNLNEKGPFETSKPYSNTIITYPHPSDSNEFHKQEEKKVSLEEEQASRKIYPSDEKSKTSSIDDGTYFIIPKKIKNLSNQSELNKMQNNYRNKHSNIIKLRDEKYSENKNVSHTTAYPENIKYDKTEECNLTSQGHTFIPISLVVPLNELMNSKVSNNEMLMNKQNNLITDQKNVTSPELETVNTSSPDTENEIITVKKENHIKILRSIEPQSTSSKQDIVDKLTNTQKLQNDDLDINKNILITKSKENLSVISNKDNAKDNKYNLGDQTDLKSHPLLAEAREKSLLNINKDRTEQVKTNSIDQRLMTNDRSENDQNLPLSIQDLNHIWENKTEALKSMADVITRKTIPTIDSETKIDDQDKVEHLPLEKFSHNVSEEYPKLEQIAEKTAGNNYDQLEGEMKQKEQRFLHTTISKTNLQAVSVTLPGTKNSAEKISKKGLFDSLEKNVVDNANVPDITPPEPLNGNSQENFIENKDKMENHESRTRIIGNREDNETQGEIIDYIKNKTVPKKIIEHFISAEISDTIERNKNEEMNNHESKNTIEFPDSKNTVDMIYELNEPFIITNLTNLLDAQNIKQNYEVEYPDDFHVDEVEGMIKLALNKPSLTSSEDNNVTVKKLFFPHKDKQSVSDQSLIGSGSSTYKADVSSVTQEDKYVKIKSSIDLEETLNLQNREEEILKDTTFKEISHFLSKRENPDQNTQFQNMDDTGEINFGLDQIPSNNLPKDLYKVSDALQPNSTLHTGAVPWKMDIALQSFVDENNERIIKSFDSTNFPDKRTNDAFLVARCYLGDDLNEIKIPIDPNNDLAVKIVNVKPQHQTLVGFNVNPNYSTDELSEKKKIKIDRSDKSYHQFADISDSCNVTDELYGKKKIKRDVQDSDIGEELTDYLKSHKQASKYNKVIMSGDIRNALNLIYEEELVPLQDIIKGLREEIDELVAYQMKLNIQNLTPKRSKPLRLVHPHKKCCCLRKL